MLGDLFSSPNFWWSLSIVAAVVLFFVLVILAYITFKNPYKYPYFEYTFDVTNKKNVRIEDYVDRFLCDERNWIGVLRHQKMIIQWKNETEKDIQTRILKKHRFNQYKKAVDDQHAFIFKTVRVRTRYVQRNYVKTPYKVKVEDSLWTANWMGLETRHKLLAKINFACTINEYCRKDQRSLMTKELRNKIIERDNYTCRKCGKYMPDKVGLHVDHIVPISKGGKSIESNLQVLCSKCNGKKGAKYDDEVI